MTSHVATKVQCDRCDAEHSFSFPQGITPSYIPSPATWLRLGVWDLCADCRRDFEQWMNAKSDEPDGDDYADRAERKARL